MAPAVGANRAMVLTMATSTSSSANASRATRPLMRTPAVDRRRRGVRRRDERRLVTGCSNLHHDGQDHRSTLGSLVEEARQRVARLGLEESRLRAVLVTRALGQGV